MNSADENEIQLPDNDPFEEDSVSKNSDFTDDIIDSTNSQKKLWDYLFGLSEEPEFQKKIRDIRGRYNLPVEGIAEVIEEVSPFSGKKIILLPNNLDNSSPFIDEVRSWIKELGLHLMWDESFKYYIAYNQWFNFWSFSGLIQVEDLNHKLNGEFQFKDEKEAGIHYVHEMVEDYPIAILINPYASQRDIIDFIKKTHKTHIEPLQNQYKHSEVKIGKIRRRNNKVLIRNKFIYENRHLSKKEIVQLVSKHFDEILDYTYIAKIISDEDRKRK